MYAETPHRRYNPLMDEWLLVSPHRTKRPWQGKVEDLPEESLSEYDPKCYLCPTNGRAGGLQNPDYKQTYVFDNDFPALLPNFPDEPAVAENHPLFQSQRERGICRVICFSPRHDLTLAHLSPSAIRGVVDTWATQTIDLSTYPWLHYVQIFENKGEIMGCSNPHPHGQLWATERIPQIVSKEDQTQRAYFQQHGTTMLGEIYREEVRRGERVIWQDENWLVLVPFWAVWPFETLLISKRVAHFVHDLTEAERNSLAAAISATTIRYDNLFKTRFPYSMGIHQAPINTANIEHWHLHLHFYPPLLRSATVKKFMVGYEMMASAQRDITAEQAAQRLRDLPATRLQET